MKRVTQRELAEAAGVSVATVSLAYSGHPRISVKTRERIRALGVKLGYRPTPGLSASRAGSRAEHLSSSLAVITTADHEQQFFSQILLKQDRALFVAGAEAAGYGLEVIELTSLTPEALRRKLEFLRVDGIYVPMVPKLDPDIIEVLASWPCLGIISQVRNPRIPVIENEKLMKSFQVFEEVARRGYRRTGIVMRRVSPSRGVISELGGLLAARENFSHCEKLPVCYLPHHRAEDDAMDREIRTVLSYAQDHQIDSLIAPDYFVIQGVLEQWPTAPPIGTACLAIPFGISHSKITGMRHQKYRFYERVHSLMDQMVRTNLTGRELSDVRETVKPIWNEGQTLPGPNPL